MEKQDARPSLRLESCLQQMDRETIDVIDNPGTDVVGQCGIAVGRKVASIQANDGRALGDLGTVNCLWSGCQSKFPYG